MTIPAERPGCRVLVTVASKHEATAELAERLAADLPGTTAGRRYRLEAVCRRVEQDPDPAQFDAVVLGSSVYAGRSAQLVVRGCRTFPGRRDPQHLTFGERAVVTAMRAPQGDFRDRVAVRSWAEDIAAQLEPGPDGAGVGDVPS